MSDSEDDFLAQAQRKAKKSFLTEEIIQQNYSPRLFTQFCENCKGADIDAYTFEELEDLVRIFKRKYKPGQVDEEDEEQESAPEEKPPEDNQEEESIEEPQQEEAPPQAEPAYLSMPLPSQPEPSLPSLPRQEGLQPAGPAAPPTPPTPLEETKQPPSSPRPDSSDSSDEQPPAPTQPASVRPDSDIYFTGLNVEPVFSEAYPVSANYIPETELSAELNAKTTIVKFSVETGGLLSTTHVVYELNTQPFNWRVHRRESDFIWLKTVLQNAYPGYYVPSTQVPPNPPKKAMNKFEHETLKKRMKFLQEFIDAILRCEIYKRSALVVGFLRETVPKQFEMLKKVRCM